MRIDVDGGEDSDDFDASGVSSPVSPVVRRSSLSPLQRIGGGSILDSSQSGQSVTGSVAGSTQSTAYANVPISPSGAGRPDLARSLSNLHKRGTHTISPSLKVAAQRGVNDKVRRFLIGCLEVWSLVF